MGVYVFPRVVSGFLGGTDSGRVQRRGVLLLYLQTTKFENSQPH